MVRLLLTTLAAALPSAPLPGNLAAQPPTARAAGDADARRDVLRLTATWAQAVSRSDTAAIRGLLAADFTGTEADGTFHGVAEELRSAIPPGGQRPWTIALADTAARVYGDAAVVTGRMSVTGTSRAVYRFTFTAARRPRTSAGWQFVAAQWTSVPDTAAARPRR